MHDEEESLRRKLKHGIPGTAKYRALQAELADILHERGDMDGALALYTSILSVTSETEDLNGGGLGSSANGAPVLPAGASVTPELDDGDSEDGDWEADISKLSLTNSPAVLQQENAAAESKTSPRLPNQKRPDRAIYVPARQAAAQAKAAAAKADAAARAFERAQEDLKQAAQPRESRVQIEPRPPARGELAKLSKDKGSAANGGGPDVSEIPFGGRHVLEIVGIKRTDSDADLQKYLTSIHESAIQPVFKWADETHALIVCSDVTQADALLSKAPEIGRLWLRSYEQASQACRQIAASELQPPTARPKTTAVVARRLLSNALQNREIRDLDGERGLRAQRKERIAQKEKRRQDLDAAWEEE